MEFVANGIDRLVRLEVEDQVLAQLSGSKLPAFGQLQLLAKLVQRLDRKFFLVSLQDINVAVGINEFVDRLILGIHHSLCLLRCEDFVWLGARCCFQSREDRHRASTPPNEAFVPNNTVCESIIQKCGPFFSTLSAWNCLRIFLRSSEFQSLA